MLKQLVHLLIICGAFSLTARSQTVVQINAGSRASWGTNQDLLIDSKGNCSYSLKEVNGPVKDSSFFNISGSQLDSLFAKAEQVGFFQLNRRYDGGYADGAGIFISINNSGKKHSVQSLNTDLPQIKELVTFLNRVLEPHNIKIYYGQSLPNK